MLVAIRPVGAKQFALAPACTSVAVWVMLPPVTVMVALRGFELVLAENEAVNVPLLLPLAGDTVSQVALSVAVHGTFEATEKVSLPAAEPTFFVVGEMVRVLADGGD